MPLMWAHAEYIKLLRSSTDGRVYDAIPEVAKRYLGKRTAHKRVEVWNPNRKMRRITNASLLRIQGTEPFRLHWSDDDWHSVNDTESISNALQIDYVDLPLHKQEQEKTCMWFTFFWRNSHQWEGGDYTMK